MVINGWSSLETWVVVSPSRSTEAMLLHQVRTTQHHREAQADIRPAWTDNRALGNPVLRLLTMELVSSSNLTQLRKGKAIVAEAGDAPSKMPANRYKAFNLSAAGIKLYAYTKDLLVSLAVRFSVATSSTLMCNTLICHAQVRHRGSLDQWLMNHE